jgi:phosphate transport system permease protein
VWATAGGVAVSVAMVVGLLALIAVRGLSHFWPHPLVEVEYRDPLSGRAPQLALGQVRASEEVPIARIDPEGRLGGAGSVGRVLLKVGNRDLEGLDFRWLLAPGMGPLARPPDALVLERQEWGDVYGYLEAVLEDGRVVADGQAAWEALAPRLDRARSLHEQARRLEREAVGAINRALEALRLESRRKELRAARTGSGSDPGAAGALDGLDARRASLQARHQVVLDELKALRAELDRDRLRARTAGGVRLEVPLSRVVRVYRPNAMGLGDKLLLYADRLWEFLSGEPRESNTEGGVFPAIFGTVMLVVLMAVLVTPLGVLAAVYLREYARQGPLTRLVRIAVNNLAGVPSIVYGVFGLGFFVYTIGGGLDRLLFPEALPAPTFGSPGLFWSSLTLALLTLPVVIVATEEGLARVPGSLREGSLALGATQLQTLWRTVLPMARPAMLTGLILAIARAAGEVAPLMLVGVVKLAPSLPVDGDFPYLHLERKFMHLGFHIYDVGFQSPNVEAARPLVYATSLLLVAVILVLNLTAIAVRNRLRERYRALDS